MKPTSLVDRLKVHIDFLGSTKFRLTTPYRQREFELSKCGRYINAETLELIKTTRIPTEAFYLQITNLALDGLNKEYMYTFRAAITDNKGVVGSTYHLTPLTVDFKMVRSK